MVDEVLDKEAIGFRITEARARLRLSVEELADVAGLNRASMYKYERGKSPGKVYFETLAKISNALQVDLMWLCYGDIDRSGEIRLQLEDSYKKIYDLPWPYQVQILNLIEMMDDHSSSRQRKNDHYSNMSSWLTFDGKKT
ncbi:MAG: helix-turn-helix transcriptional regulator [Ekhidna sp.]